jgi:F0F1-type ATP synthase assembly protein I
VGYFNFGHHNRFKNDFQLKNRTFSLNFLFIPAIIAAFFNLNQLVSMMSIGVLLAYSMVSVSVLVCSYEVHPKYIEDTTIPQNKKIMQRMLAIKQNQAEPDHMSANIATIAVSVHFAMSIFLGSVLRFLIDQITSGVWWAIILLVIATIAMILPIVVLSLQPESQVELSFKVRMI